jgi:hypothetical protein
MRNGNRKNCDWKNKKRVGHTRYQVLAELCYHVAELLRRISSIYIETAPSFSSRRCIEKQGRGHTLVVTCNPLCCTLQIESDLQPTHRQRLEPFRVQSLALDWVPNVQAKVRVCIHREPVITCAGRGSSRLSRNALYDSCCRIRCPVNDIAFDLDVTLEQCDNALSIACDIGLTLSLIMASHRGLILPSDELTMADVRHTS